MKNIVKITTLLLICLLVKKTTAQVDLDWSRVYGDVGREEGRKIIMTDDSEFYVIAGTRVNGINMPHFYLIKTTTSGDVVWENAYNSLGWCTALTETSDGGFALAGWIGILNRGYEFMLIKTDSNGNLLWSNTYGSPDRHEKCGDILITDDGGFLMIGSSTPLEYSDGDGYVIKVDSSGNFEWEASIGGNRNDILNCGCLTPDGNYLLGGGSNSYGSGGGFLARLSNRGETQWSKVIGNPGYTMVGIVVKADEGYMLAGDDNWGEGAFLIQATEEGDSVLSRYFESYTDCSSIIETSDAGYALTGRLNYGYPLLFKVDSQGNEEWNWAHGHRPSTFAGLIQSTDDGYCIVGTTSELSESQDIWLVKTGPVGQFVPQENDLMRPTDYSLLNCFPNPFNSLVTISYSLPVPGIAKVTIEDIAGRRVAVLVNKNSSVNPLRLTENGSAADHRGSAEERVVTWDAARASAGSYFVRLESGGVVRTERVILVK